MVDLCSVCGKPIAIGDWPCVNTIREHGRSVQTSVFIPYFDYGLGIQVNHFADRWTGMRRTGMQYRDLPSKGDLSARKDRIEQEKRERQ